MKKNKYKSLDFKNNKTATILYFTLRLIVIGLLIYNILLEDLKMLLHVF